MLNGNVSLLGLNVSHCNVNVTLLPSFTITSRFCYCCKT